MSHLTLILGGARSGKSRYAEKLAARYAGDRSVLYIATAVAGDEEMAARIARHRADRPAHWRTVEEPLAAGDVLRREGDASVVLIDCLTFFVTNHLLRDGDSGHCAGESWDEAGAESAVSDLISAAVETPARVIVVSNEVGMGLVPETPLGRVFRDVAGRANQAVAAAAECVVFMVAGIPMAVNES